MHEFFHATGAPHRFDHEKGACFGDEKYAFEELRAELFGISCATIHRDGSCQAYPYTKKGKTVYLQQEVPCITKP